MHRLSWCDCLYSNSPGLNFSWNAYVLEDLKQAPRAAAEASFQEMQFYK